MTPRASFVIPAYNVERWISKAILSCRSQTEKKIEIIVVNDASTDDTKQIIEWHSKEDKRVIGVHLEQNVKSAEARNIGNDKASSDLILMMDADDMATRNRVKDTLAVFELKKPDYIYGSFFVIDSIGTVARKLIAEPFDPEFCKQKKLNFICHSTTAYTKKLSKDVRFDPEYAKLGMEDWKFQWDAYKKGYKFRHLKTPLCYYRDTMAGQSKNRDMDAVMKKKEEYFACV